MDTRSLLVPLALLALPLLSAGCSGAQTPADTKPAPAPVTPPAPASSEAAPAPAPSTSAPPAASSAHVPDKAPPDKTPKRTSAPIAVHEGEDEVIATYGSGGGKSKIPALTLFVPEGAVDQPTNFIIAKNKGAGALKIAPHRGLVGEVYRIGVSRPDQPKDVKSLAGGFVITIQAPPKAPDKPLHLAVGTPTSAGKASYKVLAPNGVTTSDAGPSLSFELEDIPTVAVIHLTSSAD